jgi:hypothetical protein
MAEPYNYTLPNPMIAFEQAYNFGNAISAREAERQAALTKQAEQLAEKQKVQTALESIAKDRTPENLARNLLLVPSIKEQVLASESILNEAEKTANNQFRAEVIGLTRVGNLDAAKARLQKQAEAYTNTPGKEKEAAAAQSLLKTWDINPESVILPMTLQLYQSDKDLYNKFYGGGENLSDVGKQYQDRVRIQGKEAADAWLKLEGEKLFAVPEGGELVAGSSILGKGPITGRAAPPTVTFKPLPSTGGQTDKPSGNFR